MKIVRVALDVPVRKLFDYRSEEVDADDVGLRVLVPFGNTTTVGVIIELAVTSEIPVSQLKAVARVFRDTPPFGRRDLELLKFVAAYYHSPLGPVVMACLPLRLRRVRARGERAASCFRLTAAGRALSAEDLPRRARAKRDLLERLKAQSVLDRRDIARLWPSARTILNEWLASGWVAEVTGTPPSSAAMACNAAAAAPSLTAEQKAAVSAIQGAMGRFAPFVLLGVTGSGKTEVYLRAIQAVLGAGHQALLLVPEIALTPQLEAGIRERFPRVPVSTLHSGLSEGERLTHWLAAQRGEARIVLGTRLAVFAPLPQLGLIVIDEEHDGSFKQSDGVRYSARDVAVMRARQCGVPIVLGSATPSLETYQNGLSGRYAMLQLSSRINALSPDIECVSTREARPSDGLSARLLQSIGERLARKEQTLVFINRRGYAPVLLCRACGWLSTCHRCSAKLVLHASDRRLHCHHCGYQGPVPVSCPECGNPDLVPVGHGTERIEAALGQHFPHARILRIDRDSTRGKRLPALLERIHEGQVDILVGTQILAKGHDFAQLTLVGVVNADSQLYNIDVRASERLFALLMQVAGRAGRAQVRGEVLVQTDFPNHPLYAALRSQDYVAFARVLLEERRLAGFPPFVHQALLRAESHRIDRALAWLTRAAHVGKNLAQHVTLYDPVAADRVRLAGRERAQLLVEGKSRRELHKFLEAWRTRLDESERTSSVRWSLEIDPLQF